MFRTLAIVVAMLGIAGSTAFPAGAAAPATAPAINVPTPAAVVGLSGSIDDYNRDGFFRRFNRAKADGARTIIVEIDTWGGMVTSGLEISGFLKRQNDVYTIAFVKDRAVSAGAMIAMACNEIVMADNAMLGDCAPIAFTIDHSLRPLGPAERAKTESPIAADFYESAIRNHHDPLLSEAMVRVAVEVYWLQSATGERRFVNRADFEKLSKAGWKPVAGVPSPVDSIDRLLTVHTDLAIKLGLATGKAATAENLAKDRNLNIIESLHSGFGEAAIAWLNTDLIRMLLITILGTSLYAALHAPGHGLAEALVVTALGLLLGVPLLTGYATWWEILLVLGGIAMVAFEIFVFPHAGLMIVAGLAMMAIGLVLTFVGGDPGGSPIFPTIPGTWTQLRHGLGFVIGGLVCSALLSWWLSRYLPKLPYFNRLVLTATTGGPALATEGGMVPAPESVWPPIGSVGRAVTPLKPGGSAEFPDATGADVRIFSVVSESGFMDAGAPVIVRSVGGGRVVVRSTVS